MPDAFCGFTESVITSVIPITFVISIVIHGIMAICGHVPHQAVVY